MQDTATPPNEITWGTQAGRMQDEEGPIATPTPSPRTTDARNIPAAQVKDYFAVQVTVREYGTTNRDDQTIVVFEVPPAP